VGFRIRKPGDYVNRRETPKPSERINYSLFNEKITFDFLKSHPWSAADILRGSLDPSDYRQPIMTILLLYDTFEEAYENPNRHNLFIPMQGGQSCRVYQKT
jgi:HsdM-like protein